MSKRWIFAVLVFSLMMLLGIAHAQVSPKAAAISYNGFEFRYVPEVFGALLPYDDAGTLYQADAPYFANVAPHTSFKFIRPDPARPDADWVGELRAYRIADLEAYAEPTYREVVDQLRTLDAAHLTARVRTGADAEMRGLPFMPVLNATQVFSTHPHAVTLEAATGIEYYTYYSVAPEPILDGQIMYVFQAITVDGLYYISFSMPVETGLLAVTFPENFDREGFVTNYPAYLEETFNLINNADPAAFNPAPDVLNRFIKSISFTESSS